MRLPFAVVLLLAPVVAAAQGDPNLKFIPAGDPAMARAVNEARAGLPAFLARSRRPANGEEGFSVKVGLGPAGKEEFFWLAPFTVAGDTLTGTLDNDPETIQGYRKGQTVTMPLAAVTDWMEFDHGRMRGNYSSCVLMTREGRAALADYEKTYGADCAKPGG